MRETTRELVSFDSLNENYLKIKHKSGLTILLHQMPEFSGVYALFVTGFKQGFGKIGLHKRFAARKG